MPELTPVRIMQALNAYQFSAVMKAAIELDVFSAIAAGQTTVEEIAAHCKASHKGIRVLCDFLTVKEFLTKEGSRYQLSRDAAAFLDKKSPTYAGGMAAFLLGGRKREAFDNLADAIRKGGTVLEESSHAMTKESTEWKDFARSMMAAMAVPAKAIANLVNGHAGTPEKVLDLAAGHGLFGITVARSNPAAAIYAVDWPNVLDVAREHAAEAGVSGRWHALPGSAFEVEFGSGYDIVLLTNFLHHFGPEKAGILLRKIRGSVKPDGVVATLEFVPNEDRVTPPDAASFAVMMLAMTKDGDAYTFAEYEQMFKQAGFGRNELHRIEGARGSVILSRP